MADQSTRVAAHQGAAGVDLADLRKALVRLRSLRKDISKSGWLMQPTGEGGPLWIDHYQSYLTEALTQQIAPAMRRLSTSKPLPQRVCKILDAMLLLSEIADKRTADAEAA